MSLQNASIYFAPSDTHGLGVFAAEQIAVGAVIEICPVILFPKNELAAVRQTVLDDYYFDWGDDDSWFAFALGFGSLYNHSYVPNADYGMDFENKTIDIYALVDIAPGEEIFINYNGSPENQSPVWFEQ
ncbi:MAG: SET domain-containing protein-lysine N-methyltransferase [Bacteroidetes bacterium]|nr:MAG: SET domain-containing protein-lysine N-methyltransferase [Bacteroidota bacterium]